MTEVKDNMEIKENSVILSINPKIYPLEAIYSAAYVFLDKAYILLDGDPESEIIVELKPKEKGNKKELEVLGREFNNELINYADYQKRAEKTQKIREFIMQRALITNSQQSLEQGPLKTEDNFDSAIDNIEKEDADYLEDPEGIAVPWEEKYGKLPKKEKKLKSPGKAKFKK